MILILVLMATPAFAQRRGPLPNSWASWYQVTATTEIKVTLPENSRDVYIRNGGSSNSLCVSLKGNTVTDTCDASGANTSIVQIAAGSEIDLRDYTTKSLSLIGVGATASPVSVVVTY